MSSWECKYEFPLGGLFTPDRNESESILIFGKNLEKNGVSVVNELLLEVTKFQCLIKNYYYNFACGMYKVANRMVYYEGLSARNVF